MCAVVYFRLKSKCQLAQDCSIIAKRKYLFLDAIYSHTIFFYQYCTVNLQERHIYCFHAFRAPLQMPCVLFLHELNHVFDISRGHITKAKVFFFSNLLVRFDGTFFIHYLCKKIFILPLQI